MSCMATTSSLVFRVQRREPELITPAKPTPHELKLLSDIDDQESLRFQVPFIQFYRDNVLMEGRDPVKVIRDAIARVLVFNYPFAGRLREGPNGKLAVECRGEGIMFIEADANVKLEHFGDALQPPFPCFEDLLYDVPGFGGVLNCPLLLIQVTRLLCGSFIFTFRLNHVMSDAFGIVQFMTAVGEIARGASIPSVQPVWKRELFNARDPPRVTCVHHEYDEVPSSMMRTPISHDDDMVQQSIFFGPQEIAALRKHVHFHKHTVFDIVTACLWQCRTIALGLDPNEEVRLNCCVSVRSKKQLRLPSGFYGNAFVFPVALSKAGELCENRLCYALELVRKAKTSVTEEYIQSVEDLMVITGRRPFVATQAFLVSDVTRVEFCEVDFGWGKAVYGGLVKNIDVVGSPGMMTYHISSKNSKGEHGIVVPISLSKPSMQRFLVEVGRMTREPVEDLCKKTPKLILSSL